MAIFSNNNLKILTNINTAYDGIYDGSIIPQNIVVDAGAEMSKGISKNGSKSLRSGEIYAGSALFNALYAGEGTYKEFGWRTGWNKLDSGLGAYKCSLLFGLIPISWSTGNNFDSNGSHVNTEYGFSWRNAYIPQNPVIHSYYSNLGIDSDVTESPVTFQEFNSMTDTSHQCTEWDNAPHARNINQLSFKPSKISYYGAGLKENFSNTFASINRLKSYTVYGGSSRDHENTFEKFADLSYISAKNSMRIRVGTLIGKGSSNNFEITPVIGLVKQGYDNQLGVSDTDNVIVYTRTGTYSQQWSRLAVPFNSEVANGSKYYANEHYFGAMNDRNTIDIKHQFLLNDALDDIYSSLVSTSKTLVDGSGIAPLICSNEYLSSRLHLFNMFDVSTIKYKTQVPAGSRFNGFRMIDFIPVFAQSINNGTQGNTFGGYCCMIHTFQSIVYNTYFSGALSPTGAFYAYNSGDTELNSNAYSVNSLKNYRQCNNTWSKYNNFTMKYNSSENEMYLSYALKVYTSGGYLDSVQEGPAIAEENDWIAWINGNIWVIPDSLFSKYVFWSHNDFNMLNSASETQLGPLTV